MVEPFSRVGHDFKHGVMSLLSKTNKNAAMCCIRDFSMMQRARLENRCVALSLWRTPDIKRLNPPQRRAWLFFA
jgi:hypothetical protein